MKLPNPVGFSATLTKETLAAGSGGAGSGKKAANAVCIFSSTSDWAGAPCWMGGTAVSASAGAAAGKLAAVSAVNSSFVLTGAGMSGFSAAASDVRKKEKSELTG